MNWKQKVFYALLAIGYITANCAIVYVHGEDMYELGQTHGQEEGLSAGRFDGCQTILVTLIREQFGFEEVPPPIVMQAALKCASSLK